MEETKAMRTKPPLYLRGRRWWCYVTPPDRKGRRIPKPCGTSDYAAAVLVWRRLERESLSAPDRPKDTPLLADALETRRLERGAAGRAKGTLSMYEVKGRQLVRVLGNVPLALITAEAVDGYISTRLGEGAKRNTVARELTVLRGTLKLARRYGRFHREISEVMPTDFSPGYKPKERRLSEREISLLLGELREDRSQLVCFLLATGATYPSEVDKVTARHVDVRRWLVHLPGTKRTTRDRQVPIPEFCRPWLRRALPGIPFARWSNVRRDLHQACARAKIAPCSPNDLRRSVGTLLRARGVEPQLIGVWLGHGDSRMAERVYGRLAPDQLQHLITQRLKQTRPSTTRRQRSA